MSILYAAVIKKDVAICSGPQPNASVNSSLKAYCSQIHGGRVHQLEQGKNLVKILTENNQLNFCCVCEATCNGHTALQFLEELSRQWVRKYGTSPPPFAENQKNGEFGPVIQSTLSSFNSEQNQKISTIKPNLAEAQETMAKNLEEALRRGEKLEDMEAKAQGLKEHASEFERNSSTLKNKMCWQKWRYYIIGAIVAIVLIAIIVIIIVSI